MLSSWKEIALYFGKGVRTVQRWEKTLNLPIHRPSGAPSNVVLARTNDLEEWLNRASTTRVVREERVSSDFDTVSLQQAVQLLQVQVSTLANNLGYTFDDANLPETTVARIAALAAMLRTFCEKARSDSAARAA